MRGGLCQSAPAAVPGGWEAGSRTPIRWSRASCPTIERPPSKSAAGVAGGKCYTRGTGPLNHAFHATIVKMLPEVFECPACQRQFVFELVEASEDRSIHCPQCKRYLGEKDVNFILVSEIEELSERLGFERDRLEKDEAIYSMTDCDAELRLYGSEIHKVV